MCAQRRQTLHLSSDQSPCHQQQGTSTFWASTGEAGEAHCHCCTPVESGFSAETEASGHTEIHVQESLWELARVLMEAKKSHNLQSTRWGTKAPHLNTGNNGHPSPRKRNSPCLHLVVQSGLHIGEGPSLPSASRAKRSPLPQVDTPRNNVYQLSGAPPWPVKSTHKINPRTDKIQILNLILRKCQTHK